MMATGNRFKNTLGISFILLSGLALSACGGGKSKAPVLEGERISVVALDQILTVDPTLASTPVSLPRPYANESWPQAGGSVNNVWHHLALDQNLNRIWRVDIGDGSGGTTRLIAQPVVADGLIYTVDSRDTVSARDANTGRRVWATTLRPPKKQKESKASAFGGGVAYANGRVYVTMGYGFTSALDARTGSEIWRSEFDVPMRGAPTVSGGQVYVVTHDNQLYAMDENTGEQLWNHVAIAEIAGMLGAASPAVEGDIVIAGFSSGELYALRSANGQVMWADAVNRTGRLTPLSSISDIDGQPVIDRGTVYAIGHGGRLVAINLRTGQRKWEISLGGVNTPWVAGDYIYVVTLEGEVVCLTRENGKIKWVSRLQRYKDNKKNKPTIQWSGPILAGDRLLLVSTRGFAVSMSPYDGRFLGAIKLSDDAFVSPIVVNNTLYILTDDGDLTAMR